MTHNKIILPTVIDPTPPTADDDSDAGYVLGTLWLASTTLYMLTNAAIGAAVWTTVGSGGGGGGVSSVGLSLPSAIFDISGSPVTSSGTLTATLDAQVKNKFFVGPITGSDAAPTFRVLDVADTKAVLASALDPGSNMAITDNGDGTFTFDATGGGGGGAGIDWTAVDSITGTTTLTSSIVGRVQKCSGTSADYTVTLPTSGLTAGDLTAIVMSKALTKLVTIDATSGHLLNGVRTRVMWANEVAILEWDGTDWYKIGGLFIPMACKLARSAGAGQSISGSTGTKILMADTVYDRGGLVPTFDDVIIRRLGNYSVIGHIRMSGFLTANRFSIEVDKNGSAEYVIEFTSSSSVPGGCISFTSTYAAGDDLSLAIYQDGTTATTNTTQRPFLSVTEIPSW